MNEGIEKAVLESARLMNEFALTDKTIAYPGAGLPDREKIIRLTEELRSCMFPGYFGCPALRQNPFAAGFKLSAIAAGLEKQALAALSACGGKEDAQKRAEDTVEQFITELPNVQRLLATDVEALFDGDPAAISRTDVIFSYPGLFAITIYRLAHVLYNQNLPLIPRMMTEYAHGQTGIDINAGAKIGAYFFIDHGTGVVIGETTEIGDYVKLYQGVTLGALSTREGQRLSGVKRHPTLGNRVTVYSGASILGGETVIGDDCIIGGNAFVTSSVPAGTRVILKDR